MKNNKFMRIVTVALTAVMISATAACGVTAHAAAATRNIETAAPATPVLAEQMTATVGSDNAATMYQVETKDGLMTVGFSSSKWSEIKSEENTEMFSDGNGSILVNIYKSTDTVPTTVKQDATHPLTYAATIRTGNYQMFVVGYATTVDELTEIAQAISTMKINPDKVTDAMLNHTAASSTQTTANQPAAVTTTGASITLYNGIGTAVTLYGYTDGSWRTAQGTVYSVIGSGIWMNNGGSCLYTGKPSTQHTAQSPYKTGLSFPLYYSDGTYVTVYEYSDSTYRDNAGYYYHKYNAGQWQREDGIILGLEYDCEPEAAEPTGVTFLLYTADGEPVYIFEMTDGTYEDVYDMTYHKYNAGQWQREDGVIFYLGTDDEPSFGYDTTAYDDDTYTYGADPVYETGNETDNETEPYLTGVSFPLYDNYGNVIYVYEYSDGTYRDSCGMTYHKYNAGQWQSSNGALYSLQPVSTYQDVVSDSYNEDCYCW